jgi:ribosome-associated protein
VVEVKQILIETPFIKLEQFLKFAGAATTGGQAKNIILDGLVKVDGEVCLMRGKKLSGGETVTVENDVYECISKN